MRLIVFFTSFISFLTSAKIPGVPHDLRRHFKSSHKFKEIGFVYKDIRLKIRKAPNSDRVVLIYDIPFNENKNELIEKLILSKLGSHYSFRIIKKSKQVTEYRVFYKKRVIENAYIKIFSAENNTFAIGVNVPYENLRPISFPNSFGKKHPLVLLEGKLVEKNILNKIEIFPENSNLTKKLVKTIKPIKSLNSKLKKIKIPKGAFPDQIQSDSSGNIWFTQPLNAMITSFDPIKNTWLHKKVGKGADGIYVDLKDRVWFGEYADAHLGVYDIKTEEYRRFKIPYKNSAPAIPYYSKNDLVWLTDHENNKVLRFDLKTQKFQTFSVPTKGAWPVDIREDLENGDIYISECHANKYGKISRNENGKFSYSEISLSVWGCPAFLTITDGKVWSGLWATSSLISYNIKTEEVIEYKIEGDTGFGPIAHTPDGKIVFGSLSSGKVYLFDPKEESMIYVEGVGRLKDGLTIDKKGNVWVTENDPFIYKIQFN